MPELASSLAAWESFYVIVGTSAAALTGLTFVVIVLLAEAGSFTAKRAGEDSRCHAPYDCRQRMLTIGIRER